MTGTENEPHILHAPPVVKIFGDRERGEQLRGRALQLLRITKDQNFQGLPVWQMTYHQDPLTGEMAAPGSGTDVFVCSINHGQEQVMVQAAEVETPPHGAAQRTELPELPKGQFYHIPGCISRYDFQGNLDNAIPFKGDDREPEASGTNAGSWSSVFTFSEAGLPAPMSSPEGLVRRDPGVFRLDGGSVDVDGDHYALRMSRKNMPTSGPFSVSCVARLNEEIVMDYTFTAKTEELGSGFTIYNVLRPKLLQSDDGVNWYADCPGNLAPIVGYLSTERFVSHWATVTWPWPPFNSNFLSTWADNIGYREIAANCPGEPLLENGDKSSPYWDQVTPGEIETLDGIFVDFWEENTELQNTSGYCSYCTFRVEGTLPQTNGVRVVGTTSDGEKRYAFVWSKSYERNEFGGIIATVFTLRDYQHRKYINSCIPSLAFGTQQFPLVNPNGYLMGINFQGLMWYNGNRLLAGKLCSFEQEYGNDLIITEPLAHGEWYYVCLSYDGENATLYWSRCGSDTMHVQSAKQSNTSFDADDAFGEETKVCVGTDGWGAVSPSDTSDVYARWDFSSKMDIGRLRFYHRALSRPEATLLCKEAFGRAFVADSFESAILEQQGYERVTV